MLERLERAASRARLQHFTGAIALLRAEIALATGHPNDAERDLHTAENAFGEQGRQRELIEVEVRRVELLLTQAKLDEAQALAESAVSSPEVETADDLFVSAMLARARVAMVRRDGRTFELLEKALARARASGQRLLEAIVETTFAAAHAQAGDGARAAARS